MLKARPRFPPDKLSFALRLTSDPLFAQRFLFLKECFAFLLRLAQLGSHRVKLLFQNRTDGMLDDVFDDVVRGVVGAGRLALVLVVFEIDLPFFLYPFLALGAFLILLVQIVESFINIPPFFFDDREFPVGDAKFELQKTFVDRSKLPDTEGLEVNENEILPFSVYVPR